LIGSLSLFLIGNAFFGFEFPDPFAPVGIRVGAPPVALAVLEFPDVFTPVVIRYGALPVLFAVLEFPDVYPVGNREGALSALTAIPIRYGDRIWTWREAALSNNNSWQQ